jgi:oligopeptide/dipeptide ABC transporter ATP-binding protein
LTETPVVSVRDLRVYYGTPRGTVRAVDRVSLDIAEGEVLGLVGESGCGKSTLGRGILGLLPEGAASDGEVIYGGKNLVGMNPKELRRLRGPDLGLIFQEPMTRLNPVMRIEQHFEETLKQHEPGLGSAEIRRRSLETLGRMGIPPTRFNQYPHEFSGGMRQRIMIALALVLRPKLLIADEPTTALDVTIQAQILELMTDLRERLGMSMMLITHDLGVVAEMCDDVVVMYAGRVVERGPVDEVFGRPQHPYTEALLQSIPLLGMTQAEKLRVIRGTVPSPLDWPQGCRFEPRCDYAFPKCAEEFPPLFPVDRQESACWLCEHGRRTPAPAPVEAS